MAQLWGGRFTKETDKLVYNFNASISFDQKFYEQDIRGSKAHVKMLAKQGILTEKERDQILEGLEGILADVKAGRLAITSEYEDIHSFVEANLIDRIGDPSKKLHTGRSRNDQVALDMKLYVRDEIDEIDQEVKSLLEALQKIMEENVHTYMPGFTHLQKAQPVTLAHHVGAYFEMFLILLHILIVCQRNSLHGSKNGCQSSINTSCFSSYQLSNIRVLLLRHNTASGTVCIINFHKTVLIGIPENNLLGKTAEMHHNRRKCGQQFNHKSLSDTESILFLVGSSKSRSCAVYSLSSG